MKLTWDDTGSHNYEAGVDRGVFYPKVGPGVPWNGLTSVKESVDNSDIVVSYVDGQKIINQLHIGNFSANVFAITYPDVMNAYDGYQALFSGQKREMFNLSYRSLIGNDVEALSYGYRLHLIYNCMLTPTIRANTAINKDLNNMEFEWKLTTSPIATEYYRAASHFIIDSPSVEPEALAAIENILYGQDGGSDPSFPTITQLLTIFEENAIYKVVDNGDGTATISGPDVGVYLIGPTEAELSWENVIELDSETYRLSSY